MTLEARHRKVIARCNYDTFTEISVKRGTAEFRAIHELYEADKIIVGCWIGYGQVPKVTLKLNKRIKDYSKKRI